MVEASERQALRTEVSPPARHCAVHRRLRCLSCRLIVELDGSQHAERSLQDEERTEFLSSKGFRVVRFWNREVLTNLEGVLATILAECDELSATM